MVLIKVITFVVLQTLHNLLSVQSPLTAEVSKIMKGVQCELTFIFIERSEILDSLLKIRLIFKIKIVASSKKCICIENKAA